MRKRVIGAKAGAETPSVGGWLDLEPLAQVEITSEEPEHPIEAALRTGPGDGWRAGTSGPQSVRLLFDRPQQLRRIRLVVREETHQRTQEFVLHWSADGGRSYQELLRQQYTFSPPGTTKEVEEYWVELDGVDVLALTIIPDISGGPARASLAEVRLA